MGDAPLPEATNSPDQKSLAHNGDVTRDNCDTTPDWVGLLKSGDSEAFNAERKVHPDKKLDLSNFNFNGYNASGLNLSEANLKATKWDGAIVDGTLHSRGPSSTKLIS